MPLYGHFSLHMDRSPGFGSTAYDSIALLRLGFPSAPILQYLNLAAHRNSLARSTKSMRSLSLPPMCKHKVSGSLSLPSRGPFHLSLTVLFAIGHWVVFRLGGRSPHLQTGFHVSGPTLDPCSALPISRTGVLPSSQRLSSRLPLSSALSCRS